MTQVADDVLGKFARQQHDLFERVRKGSLDPREVYRVCQPLLTEPQKRKTKKNTGNPNDYPDLTNTMIFLWCEFWEDMLKLKLSDLPHPTYRAGFDWPLIVPTQVSNEQSLGLVRRFFKGSCYWPDLDVLEIEEPYLAAVDSALLVLIRSSAETDMRLSYDDAMMRQIPFISIRQYNCLFAFWGWVHKKRKPLAKNLKLPPYLDLVGSTRTSTLLDSDGSVACGGWCPNERKFSIGSSSRVDDSWFCGIREVVV